MMVDWGNQRFSAIKANCNTIIKEKVSNIDITRVNFFILLSSTDESFAIDEVETPG